VPTFVSQNPEAGAEQTLNEGVKGPKTGSQWVRRYRLRCDIVVKDIKGGG